MRDRVFQNRREAGERLAESLRSLQLHHPVVLAIPRGGLEVGAAIAERLGADLDVVLSRKLRAPDQPELAIGAVSETGEVHLNPGVADHVEPRYIQQETAHQLAEIQRRRARFRAVRQPVDLAGRSVIVTDDGIATGSTMAAALRTTRGSRPRETIVAVPVAPRERLAELRDQCDRIVCLLVPDDFWAVGQFYRDFDQVSDERAADLLALSDGTPRPSVRD